LNVPGHAVGHVRNDGACMKVRGHG
jgi:hypothetical protein